MMANGASATQIGDIITYGSYQQQSETPEPIEWIVLDVDNEYGPLVISRYVLDCQPYVDKDRDVVWEDSYLRYWMNHIFLKEAFNEEEQSGILLTHLSNPDNPQFGTEGGEDTEDFVFALSYLEAEHYLSPEILNTDATAYAQRCGAKLRKPIRENQVYYWFRSPGNTARRAMCPYVKSNSLDYDGNGPGVKNVGVRPAMRISWDAL